MTDSPGPAALTATGVIRDALAAAELEWEEPQPGTFAVTLPGTHKLSTTCSLVVGGHSLSVNAFVARSPDENHAAVHRWLLERNAKMYGVAFAIDHLGDIYLSGRVALVAVTPEEVDRLLGSVLEYADAAFNPLLELGFATSIRREWEWRKKRGESTANLEAFRHLAPDADGSR
jgi:hypothetical protein